MNDKRSLKQRVKLLEERVRILFWGVVGVLSAGVTEGVANRWRLEEPITFGVFVIVFLIIFWSFRSLWGRDALVRR